jgi:hypothetical protein
LVNGRAFFYVNLMAPEPDKFMFNGLVNKTNHINV